MNRILFFLLSILTIAIVFEACRKKVKVEVQEKTVNLKTIVNLKAGIQEESSAVSKYTAYEIKAREEGFGQVALLFDAILKSESLHLANLKASLAKLKDSVAISIPKFEVKSTPENLENAIKSEGIEIDSYFPEFIRTAKEEKISDAKKSFTWAMETDMKHHKLFKNALNSLAKNKLKKLPKIYFICPKCGNIYVTKSPSKCEICKTKSEKFIVIK